MMVISAKKPGLTSKGTAKARLMWRRQTDEYLELGDPAVPDPDDNRAGF
jgi:hypothetical protein